MLSTSKSTTGKKNISNKHPALKPIIHPIFFKLCGIDVNAVCGKRAELLAKMSPLESRDPYEMTADGVKSLQSDLQKKPEIKDEDYD
ncbi:hypothetical protein C8R48DRAFT_778098 [Suillus tomentosus]|nr:hypothetical protein C8R48DRAFT_778098 [Suillus tomentosus]